ncbi:hypothetical protein PILCRDRAFT_16064 [Piloderma croceum F 1598]|uniref:Uncharacterized protein n=1 Tax=Piloderma croceum (strain F 1598) TaxID=765440 RepID=A0A0C3B5F8_PILCF|nr:hypothetical protein PILCRDRAFT_16064 [Piloderma croceum F 1598]
MKDVDSIFCAFQPRSAEDDSEDDAMDSFAPHFYANYHCEMVLVAHTEYGPSDTESTKGATKGIVAIRLKALLSGMFNILGHCATSNLELQCSG